jgi:ribonuclease HII
MPDFSLESAVYGQGFSLVAGVDEVGRGPLAGPVFAAAVIFPPDLTGREPWLEALDDSKRLSPTQRERAVELVEAHALAIGVAQVGPDAVDSLGIGQASIQAMLQAVENLPLDPTYLLLDYVPLRECPIPFQTIVRGDTLSYSIAAASNVAKVARDRMMREANEVYPGYSFDRNKGYGTAQHLAQLRERGPCQIHRRSFRPVRESLGGRQVD